MNPFETMIAQYNSTLPTITNGEVENLQLTARGALIVTPSLADGSALSVKNGDAVGGGADRGFISYAINPSNLSEALKVDAAGNLLVNVAAGTISVDFTPGTQAWSSTDDDGSETDAGVISGITGSYQNLLSIAVATGSTYIITDFDITADKEGQFQLLYGNTGVSDITKIIKTVALPESEGYYNKEFGRPIEVVGGHVLYVKVRGKNLRGGSMNAAAFVGGYTI